MQIILSIFYGKRKISRRFSRQHGMPWLGCAVKSTHAWVVLLRENSVDSDVLDRDILKRFRRWRVAVATSLLFRMVDLPSEHAGVQPARVIRIRSLGLGLLRENG